MEIRETRGKKKRRMSKRSNPPPPPLPAPDEKGKRDGANHGRDIRRCLVSRPHGRSNENQDRPRKGKTHKTRGRDERGPSNKHTPRSGKRTQRTIQGRRWRRHVLDPHCRTEDPSNELGRGSPRGRGEMEGPPWLGKERTSMGRKERIPERPGTDGRAMSI